jgi:transglutaminase-like putative cysteine protease
VDVDLYEDKLIECLIEPTARLFPFQYGPEEQVELVQYRLPSYPYDGPKLQEWLQDLYRPGQIIGTFDLLEKLNSHIYKSFKYSHREEPGIQIPCDTLNRGTGSCRDFAVLMMEAVRHWGFGSRFVTGYIQMAEGQHGMSDGLTLSTCIVLIQLSCFSTSRHAKSCW